jgi:putative membrane protein
MNSRLERLFGITRGQRRTRFGILVAGVIIVPLAVAGLVAGALGNADARIDKVPAIVVNNDKMVTTTAPDGKKQYILAGRELVTKLTGPGQTGFSWTISNSAQAKKALASGAASAVLTIPPGFSRAIESLSGSDPTQGKLTIKTDEAHDYLAGSLAQSVGSAMTSTLGRTITTQYLTSLYSGLGQMGGSLSSASGGASGVASGAQGLATGLGSLASGASSAATGASQFSDGVSSYTRGVDQLAASIAQVNATVPQFASSIGTYTSGVSSISAALASASAGLSSSDPAVVAQSTAAVQELSRQLSAASAGGPSLAAGASQLQGGISQLSAGASRISAGSSSLRSGAAGVAGGVSSLAAGAASSSSGASQLATGASTLATGLESGAKQAAALTGGNAAKTAKVVAEPVTISVTKDNAIRSLGGVIGMVLVPIGLWLGALAVFMLLKPATARALASTASTGRIVFRSYGRAAGLGIAQAAALVVLLHAGLGVSWSLLPATLAFAVLTALVFVAIHYLLTSAFGRVGIVVSLVLLALQLASAGGLFPVQILTAPFQAIGPFLPLTYAIQGMQAIISGAGGSSVASPAVALLLFGVISGLISCLIIARRRGVRAFGFALARG